MEDKRNCLTCGVDITFYHRSALRCGRYAQKTGCAYKVHSTWDPKRNKKRVERVCRSCGKPTESGHKKYCGDRGDKRSCNYKRYVFTQESYRAVNRTKFSEPEKIPDYQIEQVYSCVGGRGWLT